MKSRKGVIRYTGLAGLVLTIGLLSACGASGSPNTAASPAPTPPAAPSPAPQAAPVTRQENPPDTAVSHSSTGVRLCKAADLEVSIGSGDGAGMSQNRVHLQFKNKSATTCDLQGSPGVSFVAGNDGHQVGAPAQRQAKAEGKLVSIKPGATVYSPLTIVNTGVYDPAQCRPVDARGLRIYAPDDTASMFLPLAQQACSAPDQSILTVGVVQP